MATRSLAPPGFKPKPAISGGTWLQRHPTRYDWTPAAEDLIRRIYAAVPGIHITTYVDHPEGWSRKFGYDTSVLSFDAWDDAGRGTPIGPVKGQAVVDFVFRDPNPPYVDWCIWQGEIWEEETGRWRPWNDDGTGAHFDHPHFTFKPGTPPPKDEAPEPGGVDLFTVDQLAEISQNRNPVAYDLPGDVRALVPAMKEAGIVTKPRIAAFLANVAHETDHLNTLEEYGDEAYFRSFLGDEWRYHGRGYLMNTWKAAYRRIGALFGVDLVNNPDLLSEDKVLAAKAATWFWTANNLNAYADAGNFWAVSATINTGNPNATSMNGWPGRKAAYDRAMRVLPEKIPVGPEQPPKASPKPAPVPAPAPQKPVEPPKPPSSPPAPIDLTSRVEAVERHLEAVYERLDALEEPVSVPPFVEIQPVKEMPMEPENGTPKEPVLKYGGVAAVLGALLGLLVAFGANISDEQVKAILAVAATVAPILPGLWAARSKVRPTEDE